MAGTATLDITPQHNVWMDGMIRSHPSEGVHDPLFARALVLSEGADLDTAYVLVSVDICGLTAGTTRQVRRVAAQRTAIPATHIIIAATHTHSGPAALGLFNAREPAYVAWLRERLVDVIVAAAAHLQPALAGTASGRENTVSHYRRLLTAAGHVAMNWEPYAADEIVGPLGVADPEVGVLKVVSAGQPSRTLALLFNHAGHPNVLSGDNYLLSAEYPGEAANFLEREFGGMAAFLNGAQGSVDIDGRRHRDWEGMARAGRALASSAAEAVRTVVPVQAALHGATTRYPLAGRTVSDEEWRWSQAILVETAGAVKSLPDGVGDDFRARFLQELHAAGPRTWAIEQTCLAVGEAAFLTFPGELYAEIGLAIKALSPFRRTFIIGLANGYVGYIPTAKALTEGGYAEDMRWIDNAEETVVERSLALLHRVYQSC